MEAVCPLLALAGDARSVVEGVDPTHQCHAEDPPQDVDRHLQARTCLTAAHSRCERYLAYSARHGSTTTRARAGIGDGLVSTRLTLTAEPAWRGLAGRATQDGRRGFLALGAGIVVVVLGGGAIIAWGLPALPLAGSSSSPAPSPTLSATPSEAPTSTPTASPIPTATPPKATPTPTATPAPTAAPTPTPVPSATPARTYVVQAGDTLAAIAQRFGSSVAAIQAANAIDDPNEISIGQVLVVP